MHDECRASGGVDRLRERVGEGGLGCGRRLAEPSTPPTAHTAGWQASEAISLANCSSLGWIVPTAGWPSRPTPERV